VTLDTDPTSLDHLVDIVVPPPVAWWPPAPGWCVIGAAALVTAGWLAWRAWARWRAAAYRRAALAELRRLEARAGDERQRAAALGDLPALVKRTALAAFPREVVASLSGEPWLRFLDRTGGTDAYTAGRGRVLGDLAYDPRAARLDAPAATELFGIVRGWIRAHQTAFATP
jgi:hypothetical protein